VVPSTVSFQCLMTTVDLAARYYISPFKLPVRPCLRGNALSTWSGDHHRGIRAKGFQNETPSAAPEAVEAWV
jgi:hypothetical protein